MPEGAPRLQLRTQSVQSGPDTVHLQLENNQRANSRDTEMIKKQRFLSNLKMSTYFWNECFSLADLMFEILLVHLNSSSICCIFSCLFVLFRSPDAPNDLFADVLQAPFVFFADRSTFFDEGLYFFVFFASLFTLVMS